MNYDIDCAPIIFGLVEVPHLLKTHPRIRRQRYRNANQSDSCAGKK
jgi:hypothetical protein